MNISVEYVIYNKEDRPKYNKKLLDFYRPRFKSSIAEDTINNSALICLALIDGEIVGAARAISDLSRHAQIVDLVVDEKYRRQGIGQNLVKKIVEQLKRYHVKNIGLTTEPGVDWLSNFYKKIGFSELCNSVYLKLDE
jgi:ribosomal protein S18 acetylase RimI-like enzyme